MKLLLFFNRVAFVLNILFFACLVMRLKPFISWQELASVVIIGGWFLSIVMNFMVTVWLMVLVFRKKEGLFNWLSLFNLAVFIFQLLYFIV
ncbi:MAG: hypothetical protein QM725_03070 [Lacibacter sp.]